MDLRRAEMVHIDGTLFMQHDKMMEESRLYHYQRMAPYLKHHKNPPFNEEYMSLTKQGRCYDVAYMMAKVTGMRYVEGILVCPKHMITIGHAWCIDSDGAVVDPTMHKFQHSPHLSYIGVPIKLEFVEKMKAVYGNIGVLDGNPNGEEDGIYIEPVDTWLDIRSAYDL